MVFPLIGKNQCCCHSVSQGDLSPDTRRCWAQTPDPAISYPIWTAVREFGVFPNLTLEDSWDPSLKTPKRPLGTSCSVLFTFIFTRKTGLCLTAYHPGEPMQTTMAQKEPIIWLFPLVSYLEGRLGWKVLKMGFSHSSDCEQQRWNNCFPEWSSHHFYTGIQMQTLTAAVFQ